MPILPLRLQITIKDHPGRALVNVVQYYRLFLLLNQSFHQNKTKNYSDRGFQVFESIF